jgi:hypothetical protein
LPLPSWLVSCMLWPEMYIHFPVIKHMELPKKNIHITVIKYMELLRDEHPHHRHQIFPFGCFPLCIAQFLL